jgi:hypothetical protein
MSNYADVITEMQATIARILPDQGPEIAEALVVAEAALQRAYILLVFGDDDDVEEAGEAEPTVVSIAVDGSTRVWTLPAARDGHLRAMQGAVGGYLEAWKVGDGAMLYFDEEGRIKGLPVNAKATAMAVQAGLPDVILGPALLVGFDGSPETASVPAQWIKRLEGS